MSGQETAEFNVNQFLRRFFFLFVRRERERKKDSVSCNGDRDQQHYDGCAALWMTVVCEDGHVCGLFTSYVYTAIELLEEYFTNTVLG